MKKNIFIGIIIIAVIILLWGILSKPGKDEIERRKLELDSLRKARLEQVDTMANEPQKNAVVPEAENESEAEAESADLLIGKSGPFAESGTGTNDFFTLENDLIKLTISAKGGRPYSVELKEYKSRDSLPLILFSGDSTVFGLVFFLNNYLVSTNDLFFMPVKENKIIKVGNQPETLAMRLGTGEDKYIEYQYKLSPDSYSAELTIVIAGMEDILKGHRNAIELHWEIYTPAQKKEKKDEINYTNIFYRPYEEDVHHLRTYIYRDSQEAEIRSGVEWIAFKGRYYSSIIIAEDYFTDVSLRSVNLPVSKKYIKNFSAKIGLPFIKNNYEKIKIKFYFGPNKSRYLKKHFSNIKLPGPIKTGRIFLYSSPYILIFVVNFLFLEYWILESVSYIMMFLTP